MEHSSLEKRLLQTVVPKLVADDLSDWLVEMCGIMRSGVDGGAFGMHNTRYSSAFITGYIDLNLFTHISHGEVEAFFLFLF